jgi:hypothetical protein
MPPGGSEGPPAAGSRGQEAAHGGDAGAGDATEGGRTAGAGDGCPDPVRYRNDLPALKQGVSARTVLGVPRPGEDGAEPPVERGGTPGAGGEVKLRYLQKCFPVVESLGQVG